MKIKVIILSLLLITLFFPQQIFAQNTLPNVKDVLNNGDTNRVLNQTTNGQGNLGGLITNILSVVFALAGIVSFVWAFVGVFQYITAGGSKEGLAKAKGRITWAIIGLIFLFISFSLAQYVSTIFKIENKNPKTISNPGVK